MERELNRKLFSSATDTEDTVDGGVDFTFAQSETRGLDFLETAPPRSLPYAPVEIPALEAKLVGLSKGVAQMERRTEILAAKMEELASSVREKLREVFVSIARVEERARYNEQVNEERSSRIIKSVGENRSSEAKVQQLIDRQNSLIRDFENRLMTMQRMISNQESALHTAQEALFEARNEIARLKGQ